MRCKAKVNEYYMLRIPGQTKGIPFRVVAVYPHYARLENVLYPSEYGFAKPFFVCASDSELSGCMTTRDAVIRWVEGRSLTLNTRALARKGNVTAQKTIEQWEHYRDNMKKPKVSKKVVNTGFHRDVRASA